MPTPFERRVVGCYRVVVGPRGTRTRIARSVVLPAQQQGHNPVSAELLSGTALPDDLREAALRLLVIDIDRMRVLVETETKERGFDFIGLHWRSHGLTR
jgi:hypothetical protein